MSLPLTLPTTINLSKAICLDIEADDLFMKATKVHCMWTKDLNTGEKRGFKPDELEEAVAYCLQYPTWVIHNGVDYDIPMINKFIAPTPGIQCFDTLVVSRLLNPDRPGGHSLKSWGKRLGLLKGNLLEDEDEPETVWATFTEEMFTYCERDTDLLYLVAHTLIKDLERWST